MLGLEELVEQLAKVNGMCWYGHVLRKDGDHVLRRVLMLEVKGP